MLITVIYLENVLAITRLLKSLSAFCDKLKFLLVIKWRRVIQGKFGVGKLYQTKKTKQTKTKTRNVSWMCTRRTFSKIFFLNFLGKKPVNGIVNDMEGLSTP